MINQNIFANTKVLITSDDKMNTYVLKDTIKQVKPNIKRYWNQTRYIKDIELEGNIVYRKGQYKKELYESDCKQETYKNLVRIVYNEDDTVEESLTRSEKEIKTKYIVPGSNGQKIQEYVCKN
jgi:hypothetical protein